MDVEEWEDLPRAQVAAKHPVTYDCHDPTIRQPIDLMTYGFENAFGDILHAYDKDGFRILRQKVISYQSTGALMDLSLAHTLFQTEEDDFGHVRNDVKYSVYPLAFTRHLGNIQADGVISSFGRRMNVIDARLQGNAEDERRHEGGGRRRQQRHADGQRDTDDDTDDDSDSGMDVDMAEREQGPPLLQGVCSQIYNAISHRVRDAAKFHEVQLGLVTTSLAGTTATSLPSKNRWRRNLNRCRGDLPHVRCAEKVAGPGQPQCMRFENTYRLEVQRLPQRKRSGESVRSIIIIARAPTDDQLCRHSVIYAEVVTPLVKSWAHPSVLGDIKGACVVLRNDVGHPT